MGIALRSNIERTLQQELTDREFSDFAACVSERLLDKKALLAEAGHVCRYIYFIEKGSCYSSITNSKGDMTVVQFALEGHWISDLYSFFSGREALYTIEALEPLQVVVLDHDHFQKACRDIPVFDRFFRILIQNAYVSLQHRLAKNNSELADQRYGEFSRLHPDLVQRIPQYLVASYLGVKPQSLSRIRKGGTSNT